jgi:hypothetical protein
MGKKKGKEITLKVVKKTFLEKVDINDYFRNKLIIEINQQQSLH